MNAYRPNRRRRRRIPEFPCRVCSGRQAAGRGELCRDCRTKAEGGPPVLRYCVSCRRHTRGDNSCDACGTLRNSSEFETRAVQHAEGMAVRGQAGRYPVRRLPSLLRRQGFIPTTHFLQRLQQRALAEGVRFGAGQFGKEFARARHFRQTRPGYNTRIAVVRGIPVLYRFGGNNMNRIVLVGVLPSDGMPPVAPVQPPRPRPVR